MFATWSRRVSIVRLLTAIIVMAVASLASADQAIKFSVDAGKRDRMNTPIKVEFLTSFVDSMNDARSATVLDDAGNTVIGRVTAPSMLAGVKSPPPNRIARELTFILPALKAGESKNFTATITSKPDKDIKPDHIFHWQDTKGEYEDLLFGERPVLRYMYHKLDESSKEARDATFKPYHHVFDPAEGKQLLTKGPGGLWPHHHGVFYGFRDVTYGDGKKCDIWHCPAAFQEHSKTLREEAGPVLGRQVLEINWFSEPKLAKGAKGDEPNDLFAKEYREMTAYDVPGGTLLEFASRLTALMPPVHLDGDPQHSGFHFRASEDVHARHVKETYYLRTDGKGPFTENGGKGDETRIGTPKARTRAPSICPGMP